MLVTGVFFIPLWALWASCDRGRRVSRARGRRWVCKAYVCLRGCQIGKGEESSRSPLNTLFFAVRRAESERWGLVDSVLVPPPSASFPLAVSLSARPCVGATAADYSDNMQASDEYSDAHDNPSDDDYDPRPSSSLSTPTRRKTSPSKRVSPTKGVAQTPVEPMKRTLSLYSLPAEM